MKTATPRKRGPGRPKLPESERTIKFDFRLSPELLESVRSVAKKRDLSLTFIVRQAIEDYLRANAS